MSNDGKELFNDYSVHTEAEPKSVSTNNNISRSKQATSHFCNGVPTKFSNL